MKTTIDAVNEFKGIFPYSDSFYIIHWANSDDESLFEFSNMLVGTKPNSNWSSICTKEEFNKLLVDAEQNFGQQNYNYDDYKRVFASNNKEAKPLQPVFTQKMADAGELPTVGMECIILDNTYEDGEETVEILYISKSNCVFKVLQGMTQGEYAQKTKLLKFKPIDTPIELIDGKAYQFDCISKDISVTVNGIHSSSGSVFISTYGSFPVTTCTNIKLLEVAK